MIKKLDLLVHPHDASQSLPLEHEVESSVDLREWHTMRDELLQIQLLPHVHLDDFWEVGLWLVVPEEGTLQCPLTEEVHRMGLEHRLLVGDTHQHGHTPSLHPENSEFSHSEHRSTNGIYVSCVY